jgi:hypothetical protein
MSEKKKTPQPGEAWLIEVNGEQREALAGGIGMGFSMRTVSRRRLTRARLSRCVVWCRRLSLTRCCERLRTLWSIDKQTQAAIGCLPGMTTMRIERLDADGEWRALDGDA